MAEVTAYKRYNISLFDTSELEGYVVKNGAQYTVRTSSGRDSTFRGKLSYENDLLNGTVNTLEQTNVKRSGLEIKITGLNFKVTELRDYVEETSDYLGLPFFFKGSDVFNGTKYNDTINGYSGNDTLNGESGNDTLTGSFGKDRLLGGEGADKLYGEYHDDILFGGAGADTLSGGRGIDRLYGGEGKDILSGGKEKDHFIFRKEDLFKTTGGSQRVDRNLNHYINTDMIKDFETGVDVLQIKQAIAGVAANDFGIEDLRIHQTIDSTYITYRGDEGILSLEVTGVANASDIRII